MKNSYKIAAFAACLFGLGSTFLIEGALIQGRGGIDSIALKYLYNVLFFACPIILLANLAGPIFKSSVFSRSVNGWLVWVFVLLDVVLFQAVAIFGLGNDLEFQSLYLKHFLLLQAINLFFLWACVCAIVGQQRFHPFFRDVMRNPFGAVGYWSTYSATQIGQAKKKRKMR